MNYGLVRPHRSKAIVCCPSQYSSQVPSDGMPEVMQQKAPLKILTLRAEMMIEEGSERSAKKGRKAQWTLSALAAQEIRNLDLTELMPSLSCPTEFGIRGLSPSISFKFKIMRIGPNYAELRCIPFSRVCYDIGWFEGPGMRILVAIWMHWSWKLS